MFKNFDKPIFIGKNLIYLPACQSTNDLALEMLKNNDIKDGTVIVTSEQTNGRGQRGNKWFSAPGKNLTFSILTNIGKLPVNHLFKLSMAVSTAITDALAERFENVNTNPLKIKWPNDIYYNKSKLGGILIETLNNEKEKWAVIGIGLNINQENFNYLNATSLKLILGNEFSLPAICEDICIALEKKLALIFYFPDEIDIYYYKRLLGYHEVMRFKTGEKLFDGLIKGVAADGKLILQVEKEIMYFDKKEISFLLN